MRVSQESIQFIPSNLHLFGGNPFSRPGRNPDGIDSSGRPIMEVAFLMVPIVGRGGCVGGVACPARIPQRLLLLPTQKSQRFFASSRSWTPLYTLPNPTKQLISSTRILYSDDARISTPKGHNGPLQWRAWYSNRPIGNGRGKKKLVLFPCLNREGREISQTVLNIIWIRVTIDRVGSCRSETRLFIFLVTQRQDVCWKRKRKYKDGGRKIRSDRFDMAVAIGKNEDGVGCGNTQDYHIGSRPITDKKEFSKTSNR